MNELTLNKKKYVILEKKDYELLQKRAALKKKTDSLMSLTQARAYSKELIRQWSGEK